MAFRVVISGSDATVRTLRGADSIIALELRDAMEDVIRVAQAEAEALNPSSRTVVQSRVIRERRFAGRDVANTFRGELRAIGPDHLTFIYRGTRPHTIRPRGRLTPTGRPPALAWPDAEHPVYQVDHPGTRANPFMEKARDLTAPYARRRMRSVGSEIVRRING